ncbi:MAG: LytTR family transcriptional regulator DNA-binding domain-containing protein [Cohaesibacter sp.]|nr:LytTR family transcriptional regulator DNA-binding domain-containing protein [Cohaesibacter sp.]MCV6600139.1 LytTR family transcriptional regulator DNA-binding domain-containing protein [Cohaesibacter sp.]
MLTYTYSLPLVMASIIIAILAAFTGLALTNGISELSVIRRKLQIGMAAIVIGGGIWSMHFVALLALRLPVDISYDLVWTIGSVLIEILMSGAALLILHFAKRNWLNIAIAGSLMGYGIVTMHFVGMLGIRGCIPVFWLTGKLILIVVGPATGILAVWAAYRSRTRLNIILGSIIFGLSVSVIHYVGMYWTGFAALPPEETIVTSLDNGVLALWVLFSAFAICGFFLLTSATFLAPQSARPVIASPSDHPETGSIADDPEETEPRALRVPYEKESSIRFLRSDEIAVIQAEGHYSVLYTSKEKLFCPWSISNAMDRMPDNFIRTHRSYMVNVNFVSGFVRNKDNGRCMIDNIRELSEVPISRSRIDDVKTALDL